jgi:hypothetical protein
MWSVMIIWQNGKLFRIRFELTTPSIISKECVQIADVIRYIRDNLAHLISGALRLALKLLSESHMP